MGPYQGDVVKPSDVTAETDTSLMWEVTKDPLQINDYLFTPTKHVEFNQV